jgi:methylmalonyl-CoA/ethylmalonyl-CoA epimerase
MRLIQVAQHADDLDRAARFYATLLEAEPVARFDPPGLLFFDLEGVRLLLDRNAPTALVYLHARGRRSGSRRPR